MPELDFSAGGVTLNPAAAALGAGIGSGNVIPAAGGGSVFVPGLSPAAGPSSFVQGLVGTLAGAYGAYTTAQAQSDYADAIRAQANAQVQSAAIAAQASQLPAWAVPALIGGLALIAVIAIARK